MATAKEDLKRPSIEQTTVPVPPCKSNTIPPSQLTAAQEAAFQAVERLVDIVLLSEGCSASAFTDAELDDARALAYALPDDTEDNEDIRAQVLDLCNQAALLRNPVNLYDYVL
jgi:hypothetical protein